MKITFLYYQAESDATSRMRLNIPNATQYPECDSTSRMRLNIPIATLHPEYDATPQISRYTPNVRFSNLIYKVSNLYAIYFITTTYQGNNAFREPGMPAGFCWNLQCKLNINRCVNANDHE